MKVLVCGGREYSDTDRVFRVLDDIHHKHGIEWIIQGAATGADRLAELWAKASQVNYVGFPARWKKDGQRSAGPIRNKRMLETSKPDLVVAFPGGRGTAGMVKLAEEAGVAVRFIND